MSVAECLRTVCAIAQMPNLSPSRLALAFAIGRETGLSLAELPRLTDAELIPRLSLSSSQTRAFRAEMQAPLDRFQVLADRGIRVSTSLDIESTGWSSILPSTPWLFYGGDLALLEMPTLGFSGSRDATDAALELTRSITTEAVQQGMTVVSGGARGVDMAAHTAALGAGGTTVVLVPQGLDTWWAPAPLADPLVLDRVLVMSMDLPWSPWATVSAMQRNHAIADLSEVIIIPQAGTTGGSYSTGLYALAKKRDLWVADLGSSAPGNKLLLQRGAKPIPVVNGVPDIAFMRAPKPADPAQQSLF